MECLYNHVNTTPKGFQVVCPELNLPQTLEAIVMKCMEKHQEKRFQSMLELKEALEALDRSDDASKVPGEANLAPAAMPPYVGSSNANSVQTNGQTHGEAAEVGQADSAAESNRVVSAAEARACSVCR